MEEQIIRDAWGWIGAEVRDFGVRWAVVAMFAFGFGGWFGKRYRDMKNRLAALEERQAAPVPAAGSVMIHGGVQIIHNQYNAADGKHHAEIEGRGQIESPVPIVIPGGIPLYEALGSATLTVTKAEGEDDA